MPTYFGPRVPGRSCSALPDPTARRTLSSDFSGTPAFEDVGVPGRGTKSRTGCPEASSALARRATRSISVDRILGLHRSDTMPTRASNICCSARCRARPCVRAMACWRGSRRLFVLQELNLRTIFCQTATPRCCQKSPLVRTGCWPAARLPRSGFAGALGPDLLAVHTPRLARGGRKRQPNSSVRH
jgi:hypothetical protein